VIHRRLGDNDHAIPEWQRQRQTLKFTLGDYCFWQFSFEAMVADAPLTYYLDRVSTLAELLPTHSNGFPYVVRSYPTDKVLSRFSHSKKYIRYVPAQYRRYYIKFTGSFDEYLEKFSPKSRYNLSRSVRKFSELAGGKLQWREYSSDEEINEFYRFAAELSSKTYQEQMFHEGVTSVFSRHALSELAQAGGVRGYLLFDRDTAVAYVVCLCFPGTILYSIVGFDPKYQKYSPGNVLLYLIIEKLFLERPFRYLDFGEGENWYKEFFSTGSAQCARIYYFPPKLTNVAAIGLHSLSSALSNLAGKMLDALQLRDRVRKLLRERTMNGES